MIEVADDNKDSKLSLNEIISHSSDFGTSIQEWFQDPDVLFFKAGTMSATIDAVPQPSDPAPMFDLQALDLSHP